MIAQEIVFTRNFLKASRIRDYEQPKKIACGNKKQARARVIHEFSGLKTACLILGFLIELFLSRDNISL